MSSKLKILILEDNQSDADLVQRFLTRAGVSFEAIHATDKKQFVDALINHSFDTILSDHSLPQFNSTEALEELSKLQINIPFILVTGTVSEEFAVEMMKHGADDYILKNNLTRLPSAIDKAMEKHSVQNEKKKTEEDLKIAHERLLFHIENTPLGFVEWDDQLRVKSCSQRAEEILGWTEKEFIENKMTGFDQVYKEDLVITIKVVSELLDGSVERNQMQVRNHTKQGKLIWCQWFNSVLRDEQGKVISLMSLVQDITIRIDAEESLRQSQSNLKAIIENTDASIYSLDKDFKYITFNDRLKKNLKIAYGLDVMPGDNALAILEKLDPLEAEKWKEIYFAAFKGNPIKFEKEFAVNNYKVYTKFSIHPIWENQQVVGLSCFMIDITKQKNDELYNEKMANDLIHRNKDLEQFAYIVSHNLRAPVANILGFSEAFHIPDLEEAIRKEIQDGLATSAQKLDNVIMDLNQILQIRKGSNEHKRMVQFSQIIEDIKSTLSKTIKKEQVEIRTNFVGGGSNIYPKKLSLQHHL